MNGMNLKTCLYLLISLVSSMTGTLHASEDQEEITFYLLRGIGRESAHWGDTFTTYVQSNIPQAQFVLMNLPGAGEYHDDRALPSVEKMADFLRDQHKSSMDSRKGKKIIVATSLAGNVALEWITQYPTDFQGAVLLSTSLKGVCKSKNRVQIRAKKDFINIFLIKDIRARERAFLNINSNLNVGNDSLLNAWVEIQKERPVSKKALLKQTVAGMAYKPPKEKPVIPVLLIGSAADKIVHEECFQKVSEKLESDLYLHPTAGHGIPIDAPLWLADTTSFWVNEMVFSGQNFDSISYEDIPTRTKDNGLFPLKWLDNGVQSTENVIHQGVTATGKRMDEGWRWVDHGMDWIARQVKIGETQTNISVESRNNDPTEEKKENLLITPMD